MTIFEIISVVFSLVALIVVIWQTIALRLQIRANFHQEFARRYTEVIKIIPINALENRNLSLEECINEKSDFKLTLRLYFWIIQEEYELHNRKCLPKGQWEIWDSQFRIMMQNKWLREGWDDLKSKLAFPKGFRQYIEGVYATNRQQRNEE